MLEIMGELLTWLSHNIAPNVSPSEIPTIAGMTHSANHEENDHADLRVLLNLWFSVNVYGNLPDFIVLEMLSNLKDYIKFISS